MEWYWWIPTILAILFLGGPILFLVVTTFVEIWIQIIKDVI